MFEVMKEAVRCKECNAVTEGEKWGFTCDECGATGERMLEIKTFRDAVSKDGEDITERRHFCSWACFKVGVPKISREALSFFSLPLVSDDAWSEQMGVQAFLDMLT